MGYHTPKEITEISIENGVKKVNMTFPRQFVLAILAGAFIAFASEGSNMAAYNLFNNANTYGLGKTLAGAIFGTGLMLVVLAGGELFTGNTLIFKAVLDKRVSLGRMLKNWGVIYSGNLVGSLIIVFLIFFSGQLNASHGLLGGVTIKIASYKVNLSFLQALSLGIMCNWLVTLAIWLSIAAKSISGKILGIFFPIWLFITSGFEHSIANMYYVPAGILAKTNETFAAASGLSAEQLSHLNVSNFIVHNLIPVTLGNIIGGAIFVGAAYWFVYVKACKQEC
ncbi:MAG: formate/nitrite transporter family protein [Clostridia bacterium]|nr:formate/nitrite transporter family protein [Clostridia bacterium]